MDNRTTGHRLLDSLDRFTKGDELYSISHHQWNRVPAELYGVYYDPTTSTPARRQFILPATEKIRDVDQDKPVKPKFTLEDLKEKSKCLVRQAIGIVEIEVDPANKSPSGEHIKIKLGKDYVWLRSEHLITILIEKL